MDALKFNEQRVDVRALAAAELLVVEAHERRSPSEIALAMEALRLASRKVCVELQ